MQFATFSISFCLFFLASSSGAARKSLNPDVYSSGRLIDPQTLINKLSKLQASSSSSTPYPDTETYTSFITSTYPSTASTSPTFSTDSSPASLSSTIEIETVPARDEADEDDSADDDFEVNYNENRQQKADYVRALKRQQLRNRQRAQLRAQKQRRRQAQKRRQQEKRRMNERRRKQAFKQRARQQAVNNQRRRTMRKRPGKKNVVRRVLI